LKSALCGAKYLRLQEFAMTRKKPLPTATAFYPEKKIFYSGTVAPVAAEACQQVTQEMLGLWRDHLGRMSQHAERMQKMREAAAPVFSLYTCGVDIWLNFAEAYGRSLWATETSSVSPAPAAVKQVPPASFKRPSVAKPKPIEEVLPGHTALADLARRVAEMERERGIHRPSTGTVVSYKPAAGARLTRPSKSEH
jgi:hypothetical protein